MINIYSLEINVYITLSVNCLKNLTLTLEEEISILDKYRLVPTELFLIRVLLILQDEGNEELFIRYIKTLKQAGINLRNILITLQEKEILLKSCKIAKEGEEFDPYSLQLNKNFIKNLYKCSFTLGKELFDEYPAFAVIHNSYTPLRGVSKYFNSLEDAYIKYGKSIKWNPKIHQEIIELIKWAKEHNMLNMSLGSFIVNNSWHDLKAIMNGDAGNINFDIVKGL